MHFLLNRNKYDYIRVKYFALKTTLNITKDYFEDHPHIQTHIYMHTLKHTLIDLLICNWEIGFVPIKAIL